MTIPTAEDLDAWVAALKSGHAVTGMMPRFVEGYRRLLEMAEAAAEHARVVCQSCTRDEECSLREAVDALDAPMPETEV